MSKRELRKEKIEKGYILNFELFSSSSSSSHQLRDQRDVGFGLELWHCGVDVLEERVGAGIAVGAVAAGFLLQK